MLKCAEFHGDNNDMTSTPCLIMQYKPYIVEQSCKGASRCFVCVKGQQTPMSTNVHFKVQAITP